MEDGRYMNMQVQDENAADQSIADDCESKSDKDDEVHFKEVTTNEEELDYDDF